MYPGRTRTVHWGPFAERPGWLDTPHRARHQVYPHNMVAEPDTTHWCQNGRPTQELAGDAPRTVTSETLVMCTTAQEHQANESGDLWRWRRDAKTQVTYEADNEQDEARGGGQHRRSSPQHSGTCPRYDHQRRVAPDDCEDVRKARQKARVRRFP